MTHTTALSSAGRQLSVVHRVNVEHDRQSPLKLRFESVLSLFGALLQTFYNATSGAATYSVSLQFNTNPMENNLFTFDGSPPATSVRARAALEGDCVRASASASACACACACAWT